MENLSKEIIYVFEKQGFVVVSTLGLKGDIHCAAKGIVGIESEGKVYIIDLYKRETFNNLKNNSTVSITAIDEETFTGYTLKGKAKIVDRQEIKEHVIESWENKVVQRVSKRVIGNIKKDRKSPHHPEAIFPQPQYLIEVDVESVVDLTPKQLKRK